MSCTIVLLFWVFFCFLPHPLSLNKINTYIWIKTVLLPLFSLFCEMTFPSPLSNTWCVPVCVCGKGTLSCPLSAKGGQGSTPTQTLARHYTAMNRSDTQNADRLAGGWGWSASMARYDERAHMQAAPVPPRVRWCHHVFDPIKKKGSGEAWRPHPHLLFIMLRLPLNRLHLGELTTAVSLFHLYSLQPAMSHVGQSSWSCPILLIALLCFHFSQFDVTLHLLI